jgi:hypothetical protein
MSIRRSWTVAATILVSVSFGVVAATAPPAYAIGLLVLAFALAAVVMSPAALIVFVFVLKSVVDVFWFVQVPVGAGTLSPQAILSVIVPFVAVAVLLAKRQKFATELAAPLAVWVVSNVGAALLTGSPLAALDVFFRVCGGLVLIPLVPAVSDSLPLPRTIVRAFLGVIALTWLTVVAQPLGLIPYTSFDTGGISRATGFYYHPWDVARYLFVAVPLLLHMLADQGISSAERWVYRALLVFAVVVTFLTYLKMAWIVVLVQIAAWFLLQRRPRMAVAIVLLVAMVAAYPGAEVLGRAFYDLDKLTNEERQGEALSGRVSIWSVYLERYESASLVNQMVGSGFVPPAQTTARRQSHNEYLRVLVMNGILGVLAYMVFLGAISTFIWRSRVHFSQQGRTWYAGLGSATLCVFIAYALSGITSDTGSYPSFTWYLWILVGLLLAASRAGQDQPADASEPSGGARVVSTTVSGALSST